MNARLPFTKTLFGLIAFLSLVATGNLFSQQTWNYSYTGSQQSITLQPGSYQIELWGASGGGDGQPGGMGGYAKGKITISTAQTIYIYVGGQGSGCVTNTGGGWNGGGNAGNAGCSGGGGGATDIRIGGTTLSNRKLVAGGGGGGGNGSLGVGGYGGGTSGGNASGNGGSQSAGGSGTGSGSFGVGGNRSGDGGGGGGGWYGGGAAVADAGGGGGSGYATSPFTNTSLISGNTTMPNPSGGTMVGRSGSGYARITQLYSVSISETQSISCNGGSNGALTATGVGGTTPYTYAWNTGATSASISGLTAGTYTITLTDAASAVVTATYTVTQPTALASTISAQTNVFCNGGNDGALTVSASGGTAPYTYAWSNGSTSYGPESLAAGTYTVTVTDANGCTSTTSATITQPTGMNLSISAQTSVACNGASTGSATVTASGGATPYTYAWSGGGTAATKSSLAAGTYTVTVTDANGCSNSTSATITQPTAITATSTQTNVSCNGGANGSITVTPAGGVSPYTYAWTGGGTAATKSGVAAGTYTVTITDANGCTKTKSATVTQPTALASSISAYVNVLCNGNSTGSAIVSATGGTTPYAYAWAGGGTSATKTGLAAGTHTVTVTDANGCTSTSTATITQPSALAASISAQTNVACNGASTGSATVTVSGGTSSYLYSWTGGGTSATKSSLAAGTYTVTVTDANSCTATASVTITQPTAIAASISSQTNVSCNGGTNGAATVTATGGAGTFTYAWSGGGTSATKSSLAAGTYTVTVTDANSCTATASATITQPTALASSISAQTNVLCNGNSTGAATVTATGGTTPYAYAWTGGGTAATKSSVAAGTYTVTVTDANGCTSTSSATITQPSALTSSISSQVNVLCNGASTGSATVTAAGGAGSYTYAWTGGGSSATKSSLAAGTYTVTVTDANSCTSTSSVTITQPTSLQASVSSQTNISCNGGSNGAATVVGSGGVTTYLYTWSNGATTASTSGLTAGTYTATITDANGCTATASTSITQPTALSVTASTTSDVSCNGGFDGSVNSSTTGGTSPYTYAWNTGSTQSSIANLLAGTYSITVTDNNGCTASSSTTVAQPTAVSVTATLDSNVSCFGGNDGGASALGAGGTLPYSYSWSNGDDSILIAGVSAATYTVTVTDYNGCTSNTTVSISEPTALVTSGSVVNTIPCFGNMNGSVQITASGGTPSYSYEWNLGATTSTFSNLGAGTYQVTVTDANGCTAEDSVVLAQPAALASSISASTNVSCFGGNNGSATVAATGGTTPYTYAWTNGTTSNNNPSLNAASYTVTVTDANACTSFATAVITQPTALTATTSVQNNVSCFGGANGAGSVIAVGGTSPYTYVWNTSATTAAVSTFTAGTFTVTVTDANNCTNSATVSITEPALLVASIVLDSNAGCFGENTGGLTASAIGGTTPYAFSWNNGATTASAAGLAAGTYSITVTDANGCTSSINDSVAEPTILSVAVSVDSNVACNGDNTGGISVVATGGTPAYAYSWSNAVTSAANAAVVAGVYDVTVTDANGCTAAAGDTITEPAALTLALSADAAVICFGDNNGAASATIGGGVEPYMLAWSNGDTTASSTTLNADYHTFTVVDAHGCSIADSIMIDGPAAALSAAVAQTADIVCNGDSTGALEVTAAGGWGAYAYEWSNNETSAAISGLTEGAYTVAVTDSLGCATSANDSIAHMFENPVVDLGADTTICNNASIDLNAGNDSTGATYAWSTFDSTQVITVADSGIYAVVVTDTNGCQGAAQIVISLNDCVGIDEVASDVSMVVYPNPSRGTFNVEARGFNLNESTLTVLNINGAVVATVRPQSVERETIQLNQAAGIYFLVIEYNGKSVQQRIVVQ